MLRSASALALLAFLFPLRAHAASATSSEPPPDEPADAWISPHSLPQLRIERDRVPADVTIITAQQLRDAAVSTVQEALTRLAGVGLPDAQGFGLNSDGTLNLRGISNGSRTNALVLVDGVRQNRLTGDEVHWQAIPVAHIDRIEVIRGGGATVYGEGALSGVINIITKRGRTDPLGAHATVEAGRFGWQQYALSGEGRREPVSYSASYSRRLVDGYREFSSSRNTTVTTSSTVEPIRGLRAGVNVLHSEDTTQFPGGLTLAQTEARRKQAVLSRVGIFDNTTDQVALDLALGPFKGVTWLISSFWRWETADQQRSGLFTITPARGVNIRSAHTAGSGPIANTLISGFELLDEKASTGVRGSRTDESNRQGYGAYVEDTLTVWERLSLVGGFRYDRARFEEDIIAFDSDFNEVNYVGTLRFEGKSPRIGVSYVVIPETATVFANFSRPFKAPNVDDFASRSAEFRGNVSLQPQQSDTYELGLRARRGGWEGTVTGFHVRIADEILFVQGTPENPFIFQNQNFDTRRVGVESALRYTGERLRGAIRYLFVDAEFRKGQFAGDTIPGTPAHLLHASAGVSPLPGLWVDLDWELVNQFFRYNDVTNILPADNYGVLNLVTSYTFPASRRHPSWPTGRAYVKVQNLTNEEYVAFASSNGHTLSTGAGDNPMPPLGAIGGVDLTF